MTEAQLVATIKDVQKQLELLVLEMDGVVGVNTEQRGKLNDIRRRLAQICGRLGVAVVSYDSGAVHELPDTNPQERKP